MTKKMLGDQLARLLGMTVKTKRFTGIVEKLNIRDLKYLIDQLEELEEKRKGG